MESNTLIHYGVKGMKWGVRKQRRKANKITRTAKKADTYAKKAQNAKNRAADYVSKSRNATKGTARSIALASAIKSLNEADMLMSKSNKYREKGQKLTQNFLNEYGQLSVHELENQTIYRIKL